MMRVITWFLFWAITLFYIDIEVSYTDGLHIKFNGWGGKLERWIESKKGGSKL